MLAGEDFVLESMTALLFTGKRAVYFLLSRKIKNVIDL
jgi:hypothetical protein